MFHKFPIVRQHDETDCGAAALATVALYYRMPVGLQSVRELAGTDRRGTALGGLRDAAERLGFSAKAAKGPYEALASVPRPAIAHVIDEHNMGHYVVVCRARKNSIVIADPAEGVKTLSRDEFCQIWSGYLLLLVPDPAAATDGRSGHRPNSARPQKPWRRFAGMLAFHRGVLTEAIVCAVLMALLGLSTSYFIQHLVDSVLVRGETTLLNALGIGMLLIVLFRILFGLVRHYLLAHIGRKIDLSLVSTYASHVLRLPMRFFETRKVGEVVSRVNDASKVREAIGGTTLAAVVDGALVLMSMSVMWFYDFQLALVAAAFMPLLVVCVLAHHPAIKRRSRQFMERSADVYAHLVEDVSGIETVKAYGLEHNRAERGESRLVELAQTAFSMEKLEMSSNGLGTVVTGVAGIVVVWYGGHRVIEGALTIGQLMFFFTLLSYALTPLERLASLNLQIQDALVAVDRLYEIIDLEIEPLRDENRVEFAGLNEAIELDGVSFAYGCREKVLDRIKLRIPCGATVAIVGESGSGKSTLLKLLMRFYDPSEGRILIDGIDARDIELTSLREQIGLVSQDPYIFNGTIRENVAMGRPHAMLAEVIEATRAAGLDEFVNGLPERYETVIGERGANLSGGQRQRLAIARALLRMPDILIFDEATSHLDTSTERAIQNNLETELAGKTVVLVAHRLSTVRDADIIYALDKGRIVESGTHDELIRRDGWYAELCRAQTAGHRHRRPVIDYANSSAETLATESGEAQSAAPESRCPLDTFQMRDTDSPFCDVGSPLSALAPSNGRIPDPRPRHQESSSSPLRLRT